MFKTIKIFNSFFKPKRVNLFDLSSQELYELYQFYKSFFKDKTYIQFCIDISFLKKNFNNPKKSFLILNLLFFKKTPHTYSVDYICNSLQAQKLKSRIVIFLINPSHTFNLMFIFWKKFKKLRRPKTEDNFSEFFLNEYLKKLTIYEKLNLLVLSNNYIIIRGKTEPLFKALVKISKSMLLSPKLASSSTHKFFNINHSDVFEIQFLRKNKVYNKGRYSRCRQNYRTGVYMCLYLSIISIFGLYYWFFRFSFNFTYLWWLFIVFIGSFFLPKIIKYRLYEPSTIFYKILESSRWFLMVVKSIFF